MSAEARLANPHYIYYYFDDPLSAKEKGELLELNFGLAKRCGNNSNSSGAAMC
jgi:hypothetical protein